MLYGHRSDGLRFSVDFTLLCNHCERSCNDLKRDKERSEAKRMEGRHHEFSGWENDLSAELRFPSLLPGLMRPVG